MASNSSLLHMLTHVPQGVWFCAGATTFDGQTDDARCSLATKIGTDQENVNSVVKICIYFRANGSGPIWTAESNWVILVEGHLLLHYLQLTMRG